MSKTTFTTPKAITVANDNSLATASMVLGITSITVFGPFTGIPAVIVGIIALKNPIDRSYSITGIVTGCISILFTLIAILLFIVFIVSYRVEYTPEEGDYYTPPSQVYQQL